MKFVLWLWAKKVGKEAAKAVEKSFTKKIPQYKYKTWLGWFGLALLAIDIIDLGKPATRITIPCVCFISAIRTLESIK